MDTRYLSTVHTLLKYGREPSSSSPDLTIQNYMESVQLACLRYLQQSREIMFPETYRY